MLNAVIIILREVLEASLLTSVLLAISQILSIRRRWIFPALGIGLLGAGLFAYFYDVISDGLDGRGQELSNSFMLLMVVVALVLICVRTAKYRAQGFVQGKGFGPSKWLLISAVSIASIREGAEIFLYASGFFDSLSSFLPIFVGGTLGAGIGLSIGALVYFFLVSVPKKAWFRLSLGTLTLVSAGMSAQVGLNLMQAGLLASRRPLWDSSRLLPETSLLGQLLYATLGYESSPSAIQFGFYLLPVLSVALSVALIKRGTRDRKGPISPEKGLG